MAIAPVNDARLATPRRETRSRNAALTGAVTFSCAADALVGTDARSTLAAAHAGRRVPHQRDTVGAVAEQTGRTFGVFATRAALGSLAERRLAAIGRIAVTVGKSLAARWNADSRQTARATVLVDALMAACAAMIEARRQVEPFIDDPVAIIVQSVADFVR